MTIVEVGPKRVLSGLIRNIRKDMCLVFVETPSPSADAGSSFVLHDRDKEREFPANVPC